MWQKILSGLGFIAILIAAAIGDGIGKQVGKSAFSPSKPSAQQIKEEIIEGFTKAVERSNKRGPTMIDKYTRWDKSTVGPGTRITYFYSLPNYSSQDITPKWLHTNLKPGVKKSMCTDKIIKPGLQYGGTFVFAYSGSEGSEIARFEINKDDCNWSSTSP